MEYDIPASVWKTYYETLSDINEKAAERMLEYIQKHGPTVDKEFIDYAYALTSHYGDAAGELSAQMYDYCAEYWTKAATGEKVYKSMKFQPAEPAQTASYGEVAKTMKGIAKSSENPNSYANAVGRMVKQTAEDTTLKNADRDGAEFAWVPNGDTCAFCIMLASNGWQRMSKKAIKGGHAEHIHANCDCTYAVRFDGKGGVQGYDPNRYKDIYDNAEGGTWEEKLNYIRRKQYAENNEFKEVTEKYKKEATPGEGKIVIPEERKAKNREIENLQLIHSEYGGDIYLLEEKNIPGKRNPDYSWKGKLWEEQEPLASTKNAVDRNVREAIRQIEDNPGGIVLDIGKSEMPLSEVMEITLNRLRRSSDFNCDVMVIRNEKIEGIWHYNKKR